MKTIIVYILQIIAIGQPLAGVLHLFKAQISFIMQISTNVQTVHTTVINIVITHLVLMSAAVIETLSSNMMDELA